MTGVLSYGVFVDVGVSKDGLLHVKEVEWLFGGHVHDLREYVRVGEKLRFLYVLTVDEKSGRFTLTTRPCAVDHRAALPQSGKDVLKDVKAVEMTMAEATVGPGAHVPPHKAVVTSEAVTLEITSEIILSEVVTVGSAVEEHPAAPTAAAIVKGEEAPIVEATPAVLKEVARAVIRGEVRILYDMPWKVVG